MNGLITNPEWLRVFLTRAVAEVATWPPGKQAAMQRVMESKHAA